MIGMSHTCHIAETLPDVECIGSVKLLLHMQVLYINTNS
jgi:hypothetical protein